MPPLLEVRGLKKYFPVRRTWWGRATSWLHAVDGVDLRIDAPGTTLGIAGESGCGKTTLGRVILRLLPATAGEIYFEGRDILKLNDQALRNLRRDMQIVFQDPYSALDPRITVRDIVAEPLRTHLHLRGRELDDYVAALLAEVGLDRSHLYRFPHEFSGGQRQRVVIARALALHPKFLVLDEPTSALDVSVQAQILNLLKDLQTRIGLSYLLISHDLSVVEHMADEVAIMYLGQIVERGPATEILAHPWHPYAQALLSAVPVPDPGQRGREIILEGNIPSAIDPSPGCRFYSRCPVRRPMCQEHTPVLADGGGGHWVACHLAGHGT